MVAIAIAPDPLLAEDDYTERVAAVVSAVRASRPDGHTLGAPLIPGEPEHRRAAAAGDVVHIDSELLTALLEIAERAGVPLP